MYVAQSWNIKFFCKLLKNIVNYEILTCFRWVSTA